jgi:hypothetical protein
MAERLVLHAAAALIELRVRVLHQMERIRDLRDVRERVIEHRAVRAPQVQHYVTDRVAPRRGLLLEPAAHAGGGATSNHLNELRRAVTAERDDRRAPPLQMPRPEPDEQRLIQPERLDLPDPLHIRAEQRFAVVDDSVLTVCQSQPS